MNWFQEAKFGLFIHFGLYSALAGEYQGRRTTNIAEWIQHDLSIPREEYRKLAAEFCPASFNADAIVAMAKDAGMKYVCLTAKHHEGFAMYHSRVSSYNVVDATPFGRDIAGEIAAACRRQGLTLCFYYSQAQDWDDPNGYEQGVDNENKDFEKYFSEKCIPQVKELLTQYGPVGMLWFDTPLGMTPEQSRHLRDLVKALQPDCLINGRIGNGLGDYLTTGDNFLPLLPMRFPFEVPATMNHTWGFSRFDHDWKAPETMLRIMIKAAGRGGNYLLNVGPDPEGNVPEASIRTLRFFGEFMRKNGESIYGSLPVPAYPYDLDACLFTRTPGCLYIHVFGQLPSVDILNIDIHPKRVTILATGEKVRFSTRRTCEGDGRLHIFWSENGQPDLPVTVLKVEMEEECPVFEPIRL